MGEVLAKRLVPDEFWAIVALPVPPFAPRVQGGGQAPVDSRAVFTAIVHVLTSGRAWRLLPISFGVDSRTTHRGFGRWSGVGPDFEWVTLAMMPMFLFFTTFSPLGGYRRWLQLFVGCTRLYQGIEIVRGLMLSTVAPELLGRAAHLAILGPVVLVISSRRLGRLLFS